MCHGDEVVLSAYAADYAPIVEPVGHGCAETRHHHRGVDESRVAALCDLQLPLRPIELVYEADAAHCKELSLRRREFAQLRIEALRSEKEGGVDEYTVAQTLAETGARDGGALRRIDEVRCELRAVRRDQHAALVLHVVAKYADFAQLVEIRIRHAVHAGGAHCFERALTDGFIDVTVVEQPLDACARIHAALENAAAIQIQESVDEHFRAAIQTAVERCCATFGFDQALMSFQNAGLFDDLPVDRRLLMTQLGRVHDGIAQLADADLQRPAVAQQRADVERDRMFGGRNGHVGRAEQRKVQHRVVEQKIECIRRDERIAVHER